MSESIEQLLEVFIEEEAAIPYDRLHELSDLDSEQMASFRQKWSYISLTKRQLIIKELGRLAYEIIEFSFDSINRYAIEDEDPEVRQTAINNLWESRDITLIPVFIDVLEKDPSLRVRTAAAEALGSFVYICETEDIKPSLQLGIEEALLQASTCEEEEPLLRACLESLGFSSRKEVNTLILDAYDSGNEKMKKSAVLAMGRSANKSWWEHILSELHSPSPSLRYVAAQAAGELEIREALNDLLELIDDVDRDVKHAAIWSLSQIGGSHASEALVSLYDNSEDIEESLLLQDALDNLAFVNGTRDMLLFDFNETEENDF
jgi:HEAT repeat protein